MPTTPIAKIRYPAASDAPNAPLQMANMASDLDGQTNPAFATAALRDAAITSPQPGQICRVGAQHQEYIAALGWVALVPSIVTAAFDGTPAPEGARLVRYTGTTTVTTSAAGGFNIGIPFSYTKMIYVSLSAGDTAGGLSSLVVNATSANNINARADAANGQGLGGVQTIRVNFDVLGWT